MKRRLLISVSLITAIIFCAQAQEKSTPIVKSPVFSGKTKAIRDVPVIIPGPLHVKPETPENPKGIDMPENAVIPEGKLQSQNVQDYHGGKKMGNPILNVEGINNVQGYRAADPNGDIGIDHYIQTINAQFGVFDRAGNIVYGPVDYKTIFDAFPGPWTDFNWCDPVIIYDHLADRWAFTTMSLNNNTGSYYEMVAVSVSADPLDEYYCYAYEFDNLNDYPKMSMWPNGYYITYNIFSSGGTGSWIYSHALVTAVDREAMLNGEEEATMIQFEIHAPNTLSGRRDMQAADFNGSTLPVDDACWVLVPEYHISGYPWPVFINVYAFEPDWFNPFNSTFDSIKQFSVEGAFPLFATPEAPQPGNFHKVETMTFKLMYPLHYRNLGTYEVMAGCQTMYDGEQHYLRWYEFRKETDQWIIHQSGNYMPDSSSRYDASISVNGNGDLAIGYTKSSMEINPSIWLTGRLQDDPPGEMTFEEIELYKGMNYANNYSSNTGRNRWGDYASMMVDPVDNTTFWFTSMHTLEHSNVGNWSTRIVSFKLDEAFDGPYAWAGNDTTICGYESFALNAIAENYSSLDWESSGDGTFSDDNIINPTYIRGSQDLENGMVHLCLNLSGYQSGSGCSDTMTLYLNKLPEVEAGNDDTICCDHSFTLAGDVSYADNFYWTTSGEGEFNDNTLLDAIYTPSLNDTAGDYIVFTLQAEPLTPCTEGKIDSLKLFVEPCLNINEFSHDKFSLQVFPNPSGGVFHLVAGFAEEAMPHIRILDATGKLLFNGLFTTSNAMLRQQFDLNQYPDCIFYLQVINGNYKRTVRLVKSSR